MGRCLIIHNKKKKLRVATSEHLLFQIEVWFYGTYYYIH